LTGTVDPRATFARGFPSLVASGCLLFFASSVDADTVRLANGDSLTGTLIEADESYVVIETEYAGRVVIERSHVVEIRTEEPHPVLLEDGSEREEPAGALPLEKVAAVDEAERKFKWFMELNLGFDGRWGNSDRAGVNADSRVKLDWDRHDLELTAAFERERKQGTLTGSDWRTAADYMWRVRGPWNLGLFTGFEHDRFQELDLRNTTATSVAYEWLEGFGWDIKTALGPGFIYEDNTGQEDFDFGYRYKLDLEKSLLGKQLRLRHDEQFVGSFEEAGQFIVASETGLKVKVFRPFTVGLKFRFDWNNRPAEGSDEEDLRLIFTLGYESGS
jgi:putative salt-induced outer membrane protein YdiY